MAKFSERRCRMVRDLAESWWHLTSADAAQVAPIVLKVLEHRIRDVLAETDCPLCAELELANQLDRAVESGETEKG